MVHQQSKTRSFTRKVRTIAAVASAAAIALILAACSGGSGGGSSSFGFTEAKQGKGAITVWVDATRVPAAKAFETAYPKDKIKIVTYDGSANGTNSFQTKMDLFDKAGSGWPDVVFSSQDNDASWASQKDGKTQAFAAVLDQGYVSKATLAGFTPSSLNPCTVNGHVYCLRNDLAPNVLWYNQTLFTQFGYTVPTTWEQYEALGVQLAKDHPGYIVGSVGDSFEGPEIYMWGAKCQANDITGPRAVTVNTTSANCKRGADLMDTLTANGTLTQDSLFSPDFVKKYTGKVLMTPGPAWLGGAIFDSKTSLNVPAGQIGVAAPLTWGSEAPATGDVGGATWFVSSHSKNLAEAKKFVEFVTTAPNYQAKLAPGLPAYSSAQKQWLAAQETSGYYVTSLSALTAAASVVWSGWGAGQFSQEAIWSKTIIPEVAAGKKVVDLLPEWGTAISNQAQTLGYKVTSK
ncbi:MAG TPA: extracellular solute-binding protein [Galbitalea sp.]|nr:extracellular solute-binding protein [Galbitalea sp.]